MAGALLGMLAGGALSFAGGELAKKRKMEDMVRQVTLQNVEANPELVNNPIFDKQGKSHFGDAWEAIKFGAQAHQAKLQAEQGQFKQLMAGVAPDAMSFSGGSAPPATAGAPGSPSSGVPAPSMPTHVVGPGMAAAGDLPEGMTREKFFGMPPDQQEAYVRRAAQAKAQANMGSGAPPAAAPSVSGAQPAGGGVDDVEHLERARLALGGMTHLPPETIKAADNYLSERIKDLREREFKPNPGMDFAARSLGFTSARDVTPGGPDWDRLTAKYNEVKEAPQVAAADRSFEKWTKQHAIEQADRQEAETKKDAQSVAKYAGSKSTTLSNMFRSLAAQKRMLDTQTQTQEQREASVNDLNTQLDSAEGEVQQDKALGLLPEDFKVPKEFDQRWYVDKPTPNKLTLGLTSTAGIIKQRSKRDIEKLSAGSATPAAFKAGDRREKDGVTYERDDKGNWNPVKK